MKKVPAKVPTQLGLERCGEVLGMAQRQEVGGMKRDDSGQGGKAKRGAGLRAGWARRAGRNQCQRRAKPKTSLAGREAHI